MCSNPTVVGESGRAFKIPVTSRTSSVEPTKQLDGETWRSTWLRIKDRHSNEDIVSMYGEHAAAVENKLAATCTDYTTDEIAHDADSDVNMDICKTKSENSRVDPSRSTRSAKATHLECKLEPWYKNHRGFYASAAASDHQREECTTANNPPAATDNDIVHADSMVREVRSLWNEIESVATAYRGTSGSHDQDVPMTQADTRIQAKDGCTAGKNGSRSKVIQRFKDACRCHTDNKLSTLVEYVNSYVDYAITVC